jgi:hypothetical protein
MPWPRSCGLSRSLWDPKTLPDLLNVAVSRARRRLFVIGDYEEWASAPNFGVFGARKAFTRQLYRQSPSTP